MIIDPEMAKRKRIYEASENYDSIIYWEEVDPRALKTFEYIEGLAKNTIQKWDGKYFRKVTEKIK